MTNTSLDQACADAAALIAQADGLAITAGAGMGIDSGLPDFRGDQGFWRAYPALGNHGLRFTEIANPRAFRERPELAWGFYGHRLQLYRRTVPHAGFGLLNQTAARLPGGAFVFTSNVDGQFQRSGMAEERVVECHGSIEKLQCLGDCGQPTWSAQEFVPVVDEEQCLLTCALPRCPRCGDIARPNILMFGDRLWDCVYADKQEHRLDTWLARQSRAVIIEIGAGTWIPSVRVFGESQQRPLIRVNPGESDVGSQRDIGIALGALDGISRIAAALDAL
ncbi:SIR2 family NAD-dependent protein deacylase [Massilia antarctica]|uniref:SIR2 family NAD-dependent protein deacylase n=1 Tax=Massilia antarctica TaxID=2765360 RepID=UPI0006BB92BC|nr:Sir2 family NAD-dependent protein deacetylase [Massilia sp. H27-R4]MCY0911671.1 NAD-dependent deacetylase [Massilia sp. H27-R4]CUI04655.1 NAD-dependent protein deacetylase of SIR2 family [Janthinobacterium sp. CG23_2]CUU28441.1 NAD-dependent protein deacetylase of SIR2 family [Janthinobacterium sp. CG23_2]